MKKLFLFPALLLAGLLLTAQEGIQFEKGAWADALAAAKAQDKLIFMDAYTTWCGPCKMMARDVFTDADVSAFFNENFVNVKMDMEAGEGLQLAREYKVRAYPTLLFIDGDGMLVHRGTGYHEAGPFIELGQTALNPEMTLSAMQERFAAGDRDPAFLFEYAFAAYEAYDGSHKPVVKAYLETQENWNTMDNMMFIFTFVEDTDSPLFDYLVENREQFELLLGKEEVIGQVQNVILNSLQKGESTPEQIEKLYAKAFPDQADQLTAQFRMNYYRMARDQEKYVDAAVHYYNTYPSDNYLELNNVAWNFYETADDPDHLKAALAWARQSVELSDEYFNNDTLAALYYKLGKKKKAREAAQHAIELAKREGEDYSGTEELLEMIEEM